MKLSSLFSKIALLAVTGQFVCHSQSTLIFSNSGKVESIVNSTSYDVSGKTSRGPKGTISWSETSFMFVAGSSTVPRTATIKASIDAFPSDEPSNMLVNGYLWTHDRATNLPGTIIAEWTFIATKESKPGFWTDSSPIYTGGEVPVLVAGECYWFSLRRDNNIPREFNACWYNNMSGTSLVAQRSATKDFTNPLTITPWITERKLSPSLELNGVAQFSSAQ